MVNESGEKYCPACFREKNAEACFSKRKEGDGYAAWCKVCHNRKQRGYSRTPEAKEARAAYRAREEVKQRDRDYQKKYRRRRAAQGIPTVKTYRKQITDQVYKDRKRLQTCPPERREHYRARLRTWEEELRRLDAMKRGSVLPEAPRSARKIITDKIVKARRKLDACPPERRGHFLARLEVLEGELRRLEERKRRQRAAATSRVPYQQEAG
jgi:hypothetical protein